MEIRRPGLWVSSKNFGKQCRKEGYSFSPCLYIALPSKGATNWKPSRPGTRTADTLKQGQRYKYPAGDMLFHPQHPAELKPCMPKVPNLNRNCRSCQDPDVAPLCPCITKSSLQVRWADSTGACASGRKGLLFLPVLLCIRR